MFIIKLQDRKGNDLNEGDIVRITDQSGRITFFSEVKYLEEHKAIAPFHTFAFHSVEKVDAVPPEARPCFVEERYRAWYLPAGEADEEGAADKHHKYLTSWRECEYQLNDRAFRIERLPS